MHVPFPGGGQTVELTIAGHTAILHITLPLVAQHIKDEMRVLAIASSKRSPLFPDVPTLAEAGMPNHEVAFWVGMLVPTGTSKDRINALHQQTTESFARRREGALRIDRVRADGSTPKEFADYLKAEFAEWGRVVRDAKVKIE